MRRVILESPYAAGRGWTRLQNIAYARRCVRDALMRGEAPIASHLLYTQPGILKDGIKHERNWGIAAGLAWGAVANATIVYTDHGISSGMQHGIEQAQRHGRRIEYRSINEKRRQPNAKSTSVFQDPANAR